MSREKQTSKQTSKLTTIACTFILGCLAILAFFLLPYANEIAHIVLIVLIAAAIGGGVYIVLRLVGFALPLVERLADIHHKRVLTEREKEDMALRRIAMEHARENNMQVKIQDIAVTHLPQPRGSERLPVPNRRMSGGEYLPVVRVTEALPLPGRIINSTLALPKPTIQKPTIQELVNAVEPNSFTFGLGRSLTTDKLVTVELPGKHLKVIGATQMGKSCLVASIIEQLRQTHDNDHLQLAILDLENMTGRLFENDNHIMEVKTNDGVVKLHARNVEQVADYIILLHKVMLWIYNKVDKFGWECLDKLPLLLIYFEEFLYWRRMLAQFVTNKQRQEEAIAAITGIATRGLKVKMHLVVAAQVGYRDEKLVDAMAQFAGINVSLAVVPSAARAAGFVSSDLLKKNFEAKTPGRYVVETIGGADTGIAADFDVRALVKSLGGNNQPQEYSSEIEEAGEFEGVETLPVVTQEQPLQADSIRERLQAVYDACQKLGTTNNRVIAAHLSLSDSMTYRLIQRLERMGRL